MGSNVILSGVCGGVYVVGNIPYGATEEMLREVFAEVGQILSFRFVVFSPLHSSPLTYYYHHHHRFVTHSLPLYSKTKQNSLIITITTTGGMIFGIDGKDNNNMIIII